MSNEEKTVKFPHRRSIGTLYVADSIQPEEWELLSQVRGLIVAPENQPIKWEWLEEARGTVKVQAGKKLKLKIIGKGSGSLAPLADLKPDDLHTLDVSRSEVSDLSLSHITHLCGLKVLELTSTSVTDEGLVHLKNLVGLQGLGLSHCHITGRGVKDLDKLQDLHELWLSSADITDGELPNITIFKSLVQLGLSGTKVSDEGLQKLSVLQKLLRLYVFNTQVTKSGMEKMRQLVPNCRVKWKPQARETAEDQDLDIADSVSGSSDLMGMFEGLSPELSSIFSGSKSVSGHNANGKSEEEFFWEVIDQLDWDKAGDDDQVIEPAVQSLARRPDKDIRLFADILSEKLHRLDGESFAREIGEDSYRGRSHQFSRNWFLRVRCCVIANGQEYYAEVLKDPKAMPKDLEFEAILRIATRAYERKTGNKLAHIPKFNYETFANKSAWGQN